MSNYVLDTSAFLALRYQERGAAQVADAIDSGAAMSAVNVSEIVAKLSEAGLTEEAIREALDVELEVLDFTAELAFQAGLLRPLTRQAGLSLGDRACLALARYLQLPVLTADRAWEDVPVGVEVRLVR